MSLLPRIFSLPPPRVSFTELSYSPVETKLSSLHTPSLAAFVISYLYMERLADLEVSIAAPDTGAAREESEDQKIAAMAMPAAVTRFSILLFIFFSFVR